MAMQDTCIGQTFRYILLRMPFDLSLFRKKRLPSLFHKTITFVAHVSEHIEQVFDILSIMMFKI